MIYGFPCPNLSLIAIADIAQIQKPNSSFTPRKSIKIKRGFPSLFNHNQTAKQNGDFGERIAPALLETRFGKIEFMDDIIDFKSETGIYIEIKTCQQYINSANPKYPMRNGRFILEKSQHTYLISKNGYYVFIVKNGEMVINVRIISASKIKFARCITWKRLIAAFPSPRNVNIPAINETLKTPANNDYVYETNGTVK